MNVNLQIRHLNEIFALRFSILEIKHFRGMGKGLQQSRFNEKRYNQRKKKKLRTERSNFCWISVTFFFNKQRQNLITIFLVFSNVPITFIRNLKINFNESLSKSNKMLLKVTFRRESEVVHFDAPAVRNTLRYEPLSGSYHGVTCKNWVHKSAPVDGIACVQKPVKLEFCKYIYEFFVIPTPLFGAFARKKNEWKVTHKRIIYGTYDRIWKTSWSILLWQLSSSQVGTIRFFAMKKTTILVIKGMEIIFITSSKDW